MVSNQYTPVIKFFLIAVFIYCVPVLAQVGSIKVGGTNRDFTVYAPSSGLPENPPLILALHALGQTASNFRSVSGWDAIADKQKIIIVYPVGIYKVTNMNNMIGWDIYSDSDMEFLTALIDTLANRYKIDRKRVYSTGFSMGGMMSYKLACSATEKIAAIGPDGGYPVGTDINSCKPSAPISVCHVHGADDDFVKYSGVGSWISKFVSLNKCSTTPTTNNPSSKAKKEYYGPGENGNEVILYTVAGMAHDYATSSKYGFSATDTFWAFFSKHPGSGTGIIKGNNTHNKSVVKVPSICYHAGKVTFNQCDNVTGICLLDVSGRIIGKWTTASFAHSLKIEPLTRGIYLLSLERGDSRVVMRLPVQ